MTPLFALLIMGAIAVVVTFLMMVELLITMLPLVIVAVAVIVIVRLGRTTSHRVVLVPPTPLTPRAGGVAGPAVYRYRGTSHPLRPALQGWMLVPIRLAGPDAPRPDVIDAEVIGEGGHDA
jgi:hypothetical protein